MRPAVGDRCRIRGEVIVVVDVAGGDPVTRLQGGSRERIRARDWQRLVARGESMDPATPAMIADGSAWPATPPESVARPTPGPLFARRP